MKLSVIIPVYNVELYLAQCLDSVIGQTYKVLEIILVNDGSTDNSLAICESYAERDSRIKLINKSNGGLSSARNAGLNVATGDLITFLDSDDWIDLDAYEQCISALQKHPSASMIAFAFMYYYENTKEYKPSRFPFQEGLFRLDSLDIIQLISDVIYMTACNKVYRKELIGDLRFLEGFYHEDEYFTTELVVSHMRDEVYCLVNPCYKYRQRASSITHQKSDKNYIDMCKGFDIMLERIEQSHPDVLQVARRYADHVLGMATYSRARCSPNKELRNACRRVMDRLGLSYKKRLLRYNSDRWIFFALVKVHRTLSSLISR